MSKKSFYRISWKEIGYLLAVDFALLAAFAYWNITQCYSAQNMIVINPQIICPAIFFLNEVNLGVFFAVVLVVNFVLSGYWHFVVKK